MTDLNALGQAIGAALGDAVAAYEREFGPITDDELAAQVRQDRAAARVVRGRARRVAKPGPRGRRGKRR